MFKTLLSTPGVNVGKMKILVNSLAGNITFQLEGLSQTEVKPQTDSFIFCIKWLTRIMYETLEKSEYLQLQHLGRVEKTALVFHKQKLKVFCSCKQKHGAPEDYYPELGWDKTNVLG